MLLPRRWRDAAAARYAVAAAAPLRVYFHERRQRRSFTGR